MVVGGNTGVSGSHSHLSSETGNCPKTRYLSRPYSDYTGQTNGSGTDSSHHVENRNSCSEFPDTLFQRNPS